MKKAIINSKNKGFTIVELLVVIVVIGILAAITMISYNGVTAKAQTTENQSNANIVITAANGVYAELGSYPATSATAATVLNNLNAGVTKVPSTLTVTNVTATAGKSLSYRLTSDGKGICVGYWDYTGTAAAKYYYGGTATADNGTTCS